MALLSVWPSSFSSAWAAAEPGLSYSRPREWWNKEQCRFPVDWANSKKPRWLSPGNPASSLRPVAFRPCLVAADWQDNDTVTWLLLLLRRPITHSPSGKSLRFLSVVITLYRVLIFNRFHLVWGSLSIWLSLPMVLISSGPSAVSCLYLPKNKTELPLGNPVIFSSLKRPVGYRPRLMASLTFSAMNICKNYAMEVVTNISG